MVEFVRKFGKKKMLPAGQNLLQPGFHLDLFEDFVGYLEMKDLELDKRRILLPSHPKIDLL